MDDVLVRIKRAVLAGRYIFTEKASIESEADGLTEMDVVESILNAVAIYKTLRSRSSLRARRKEYLYVIQSPNLDGLAIYSRGKLVREAGSEVYLYIGVLEEGSIRTLTMLKTTICPTCGGRKIKRVRRDCPREIAGHRYTIPNLLLYECPNCGERLYDREAMRKIEAYSPALHQRVKRRLATRRAG